MYICGGRGLEILRLTSLMKLGAHRVSTSSSHLAHLACASLAFREGQRELVYICVSGRCGSPNIYETKNILSSCRSRATGPSSALYIISHSPLIFYFFISMNNMVTVLCACVCVCALYICKILILMCCFYNQINIFSRFFF